MPSFVDRIKNSWNAFLGRDPTVNTTFTGGTIFRPDHVYLKAGSERSVVSTVYNKIAVDASQIDIEHVRLDDDKHYIETLDSSLNEILTTSANIDQTGRKFIQDLVMSMCDEGYVAAAIIDADKNPRITDSYNIRSMRTGRIVEWFPYDVKIECYDERLGRKNNLILPKSCTAIIENPFYEIMNRPNSTAQRLIRTLAELDHINHSKSSGKLDVIIQLPYIAKTKTRQDQAEVRRLALEEQMEKSKLGIGYIDGTERIIQLNRPLENNLWKQAQELTEQLYSQLGLTPEVFNGTADPKVMKAYYSRTIKPFLCAITEEMTRKFISKTARTQGQSIRFFRNPFELLPATDMGEVSKSFITGQILTANEFRSELGYKPKDEPQADELVNPNINPIQNTPSAPEEGDHVLSDEEYQEVMDELDKAIKEKEKNTEDSLKHSDEMKTVVKRYRKRSTRAPNYIPGNRVEKQKRIEKYMNELKGG